VVPSSLRGGGGEGREREGEGRGGKRGRKREGGKKGERGKGWKEERREGEGRCQVQAVCYVRSYEGIKDSEKIFAINIATSTMQHVRPSNNQELLITFE